MESVGLGVSSNIHSYLKQWKLPRFDLVSSLHSSPPLLANCISSAANARYYSSFIKITADNVQDYSIRETKEVKVYVQKNLESGYPCQFVADKVQRRAILQLVGVNVILGNVSTAVAAPVQEMKEPDVLRTLKLPSGVIIQDIVEGQGQEAREEDIVEFNYVCRRSNGYFVHSTVNQFSGESSPVILRLNEARMIKGLKEVLTGMKIGGKRRALIPPSVGYTSEALQPVPEEFGPRRSLLSHAKEPLIFEVQLLKVL